MPKPENITVKCISLAHLLLCWEAGGARYHVSLDAQALPDIVIRKGDRFSTTPSYLVGKAILFKNPPLGFDHRSKGFFRTRHLDAGAGTNLAMVSQAVETAKRLGLAEKALADYAAEQDRREQARKNAVEDSVRAAIRTEIETLRAEGSEAEANALGHYLIEADQAGLLRFRNLIMRTGQ